jgi:hypothetical protein
MNLAMAAADLVPFSSLLGAVVGGVIGYLGALGLTKRGEAQMHEAVCRQLRDLLDSVRARFTKLKKYPGAHFVREDPAIKVLLDRGFSADSARSLNCHQGRLVQEAILRSVRVAAEVDELLQHAALEKKEADKLKEGGTDDVIARIEKYADDVIARIDEAVAALKCK